MEGNYRTIDSIIKHVELENCLRVDLLEVGMKILLETQHNIYEFEKIEHPNVFLLQGGQIFKTPERVRFNSCTFGGTSIWLYRIGKDLFPEIITERENPEEKKLRMSAVKSAKVIGPTYEIEVFEKD